MHTDDSNTFKPAHLRAWLETTRDYLFSDRQWDADATACALCQSGLDSHGARDRFVSRARGHLLRLMKSAAQRNRDPLLELERAFKIQAAFITRHPEIPRRLLRWLLQGGDSRIQRRVRKVVSHYESRIARLIARARLQGTIRADIDPHAAASVVIGMIQSLAFRLSLNLCQRERVLHEAYARFALFRMAMGTVS